MIPYATCMQLRKSGKRRSDGRRWVAFSQFDDSNANQEDGASAGVSGAQDAPSRPMPVRVEAQSSNGVISFIWSTPDVCPEIQVDAHFHVVDDDCMMPKEDDDTSTLSTRVCRRRSSSSIRFADDTDTGTDILMITEEGLEEILVDPTGTTIPSSAESTLKLSPVTSASSTPHFIGIHRYHVAGAGALKVPCDVNDQAALQNRMLLTLRRRKSGQKSIHIDPIALLDYSYHGVTQRFLHNACNWGFNSFTLDTLTGGHSLSQLLGYLFTRYNFIEIFDLDVVNTWKLFRLFENGYHDTNPYHNSVHAADVTQAMHCFIEEEKISKYMTPMEKMCSLLAAVAHDLDHPGVNQHFLIATKSHLASLYNNLSVLESHHWRFAISCIRESKVFDHFDGEQWEKVQHLLSSLILATDITQQATYLLRFRKYLSSPETFSMEDPENRLFILQIALKCADLCNPCRPWLLSHKWTTQICAEFYRQGDYEKMLKIPVTPICNRQIASMAKIQIDFFRNVVSPLFELWDQFLSSRLSRKILNNLRFNNSQWESSYTQLRSTRRHSCSVSEGCRSGAPIRLSKSVSDLKVDLKVPDIRDLRDFSATIKIDDHKKTCDGVNGCGTPSITSSGSPSPSSEDCTQSEQYRDNIGNLRSPFINLGSLPSHHLKPISSQSLLDTAQYLSGRRGSAPGCIGIYTSCELAAAAALVFLHGAVTSKHPKRRSSFPVEHADGCFPYNNTSTGYHHRHYNGAKLNWPHMGPKIKGRSLEVLMTSLSAKNKLLTRQACSLDSSAEFKQWLMNSKPRRGSIPQEILIESLANYSSQEGL